MSSEQKSAPQNESKPQYIEQKRAVVFTADGRVVPFEAGLFTPESAKAGTHGLYIAGPEELAPENAERLRR